VAFFHRGIRSRLRRCAPEHLGQALRAATSDDTLLVDWINRGDVRENWGDKVAPHLVSWLSGKRVANSRDAWNLAGKPVYTTIGSMLGTIDRPHVNVWGTGFVDSAAQLRREPEHIFAVRGPLTRQKLIDSGVACPPVYGDPALLMPRFYRPRVEVTHVLGVIPHHKELGLSILGSLGRSKEVRIIDIRSGLRAVIDALLSCNGIVSGSLHGLVLADAYGLPSRWMRISDLPAGDGFKFIDYLSSVGHDDRGEIPLCDESNIGSVIRSLDSRPLTTDLASFLDACPFLASDASASMTVEDSTSSGWPPKPLA
jgi:pyruvyltransferase